MMTTDLFDAFKEAINEEIKLQIESDTRCLVLTPFRFNNGDHLVIILKREGNKLYLTDEGHTYSRYYNFFYSKVFYNPKKDVCKKIIDETVAEFGLVNQEHTYINELIKNISESDYKGLALFNFAQALITINNVLRFTDAEST